MRKSMFLMEGLKLNNQRIFSLKIAKNLIIWLIVIFLFDFFLFPMPTLANEAMASSDIAENGVNSENIVEEENGVINEIIDENANNIENLGDNIGHLPQNNNKSVKKSGSYLITAYNSEAAQTDGSPCITANGFNVCEHGIEDTVAANFLPFGSKIKIPGLFGDRVFIVRDRMNARYSSRLDVWMLNKADAKQFGVKLAKIEVLEP